MPTVIGGPGNPWLEAAMPLAQGIRARTARQQQIEDREERRRRQLEDLGLHMAVQLAQQGQTSPAALYEQHPLGRGLMGTPEVPPVPQTPPMPVPGQPQPFEVPAGAPMEAFPPGAYPQGDVPPPPLMTRGRPGSPGIAAGPGTLDMIADNVQKAQARAMYKDAAQLAKGMQPVPYGPQQDVTAMANLVPTAGMFGTTPEALLPFAEMGAPPPPPDWREGISFTRLELERERLAEQQRANREKERQRKEEAEQRRLAVLSEEGTDISIQVSKLADDTVRDFNRAVLDQAKFRVAGRFTFVDEVERARVLVDTRNEMKRDPQWNVEVDGERFELHDRHDAIRYHQQMITHTRKRLGAGRKRTVKTPVGEGQTGSGAIGDVLGTAADERTVRGLASQVAQGSAQAAESLKDHFVKRGMTEDEAWAEVERQAEASMGAR